jgi:hypothetical protein
MPVDDAETAEEDSLLVPSDKVPNNNDGWKVVDFVTVGINSDASKTR